MGWAFLGDLVVVIVASAAASAAMIIALRPLLLRYALARPNARSLHTTPTPQGGGIAVVLATLIVSAAAPMLSPGVGLERLMPLFAGVLVLAGLGIYDDIRPLDALPKLAAQILAVVLVVATLPNDLQVTPGFPLWVERVGEVLAGIYIVNIVNFMDGIDWMTVSEVVPFTAAVLLLAIIGALAPPESLLAAALFGAMLGFAPFNRPIAKLFLGDVGSLPIGLLVFYLLLSLAARGHLVAAIILPLYYLADATLTLARRTLRGENIFVAHRTHVYQIARARGMSVTAIIARVFAVNVLLALLAIAAVWMGGAVAGLIALATAAAVVTLLLVDLSRGAR